MIDVTPVILCGGSGTRLWPFSRTGFPKQFLCLQGNESLFQQMAKRLSALAGQGIQAAPLYVVAGEDHRFLVTEQLREAGIEPGPVLLEPVGRNTAPALTLAALAAGETGRDPVLVVVPSDQAIDDDDKFITAIRAAVREAQEGAIVLLGVPPDAPKTGYGYIQTDPARADGLVHTVRRFVEKPDEPAARRYLEEGAHYWNAGVFVLKASVWLQALGQFRPDILQATRDAWAGRTEDGPFLRPSRAAFSAIVPESVDFAVIEHCPGSPFPLRMVRLESGWSDLGSWDVVWKSLPKDENGNALVGDVFATGIRDTLVHASSCLVALVGVEDLVVVETPDAVLVARKSRSQEVRHLVATLADHHRRELALHRKVYRPWGWYDCIDEGDRSKVKRILVNPGASLSLQKHFHRAEHWVVVKDTAEITRGNEALLLTENQSTCIPPGKSTVWQIPATLFIKIPCNRPGPDSGRPSRELHIAYYDPPRFALDTTRPAYLHPAITGQR